MSETDSTGISKEGEVKKTTEEQTEKREQPDQVAAPQQSFQDISIPKECNNFLHTGYCSYGTLCAFQHDYNKATNHHIMAYLDGIVSEIACIKSKLFSLEQDSKKDVPAEKDNTRRAPKSVYMNRVQRRARSRSQERTDVYQQMSDLCTPINYMSVNPQYINPPHFSNQEESEVKGKGKGNWKEKGSKKWKGKREPRTPSIGPSTPQMVPYMEIPNIAYPTNMYNVPVAQNPQFFPTYQPFVISHPGPRPRNQSRNRPRSRGGAKNRTSSSGSALSGSGTKQP